jgi:hypothetical protein
VLRIKALDELGKFPAVHMGVCTFASVDRTVPVFLDLGFATGSQEEKGSMAKDCREATAARIPTKI